MVAVLSSRLNKEPEENQKEDHPDHDQAALTFQRYVPSDYASQKQKPIGTKKERSNWKGVWNKPVGQLSSAQGLKELPKEAKHQPRVLRTSTPYKSSAQIILGGMAPDKQVHFEDINNFKRVEENLVTMEEFEQNKEFDPFHQSLFGAPTDLKGTKRKDPLHRAATSGMEEAQRTGTFGGCSEEQSKLPLLPSSSQKFKLKENQSTSGNQMTHSLRPENSQKKQASPDFNITFKNLNVDTEELYIENMKQKLAMCSPLRSKEKPSTASTTDQDHPHAYSLNPREAPAFFNSEQPIPSNFSFKSNLFSPGIESKNQLLPSISKGRLMSNRNSPVYDSNYLTTRKDAPSSAGSQLHFPKNVFTFVAKKQPAQIDFDSQKSKETPGLHD